ncbi:hypothetical protein N7486_003924 [Penicillium sp. IBT 16267x]|nr:hypothetical protein N7486_003924 [Penicillium sp. IBT 16267x]
MTGIILECIVDDGIVSRCLYPRLDHAKRLGDIQLQIDRKKVEQDDELDSKRHDRECPLVPSSKPADTNHDPQNHRKRANKSKSRGRKPEQARLRFILEEEGLTAEED